MIKHKVVRDITTKQRKEITSAYVTESLRKMTLDEMFDLLRQTMTSRMNRLTQDEFIATVEAFEPDLLPCECDECVEGRMVAELVKLFRAAHS